MLGKLASGPLSRSLRPSQVIKVNGKRDMSGMVFGKRQIEQVRNWIPSALIYGAASGVALCYFTDWRVVCDWIPFYNGKYKKD